MQSDDRCKRLLPDKIPGGQQSDGGLFAVLRNYSDPCAALLQIKDRIGSISLAKNVCVGFNSTMTRPSPAFARKAAVSNGMLSLLVKTLPRLGRRKAHPFVPNQRDNSVRCVSGRAIGRSAPGSIEVAINLCPSSPRFYAAVWSIPLNSERRTCRALSRTDSPRATPLEVQIRGDCLHPVPASGRAELHSVGTCGPGCGRHIR